MLKHKHNLLNQAIDVAYEFESSVNAFYCADEVEEFGAGSGTGYLKWKRYAKKPRMAFNQLHIRFEDAIPWEFPPAYEKDAVLPFSISFVSERTIRLQFKAKNNIMAERDSIMIAGKPREAGLWEYAEYDDKTVYKSYFGSVTITYRPFHIEIRDGRGVLLTRTQHLLDTMCMDNTEPMPFSFVRSVEDLKRYIAASFTLNPGERIYGCGESFTALNKRGQKVILWTTDSRGVQTRDMYKPIPFFMSSRGYGMFVHNTVPMTFDFGHSYDAANTLYIGDDSLDIFVFIGTSKEILSEYTALTGRSPIPPLWSFGLWMSRITYKSENEVREVAEKLREHRIPCDVIHIDTGWFETDWCCDYEFSKTRFKDPEKMIDDLKNMGFKISLWQLPYFTPANRLYKEAFEKGYVIYGEDGRLPTEDAILDFSNPQAVTWYQGLLERLLRLGVGAIKADFGEAAPIYGRYASGKSGFYEHNLYPLRYNKAVAEITEKTTGENIIWARSAWAGSQRYPVHWGGDAENSDSGMAATLRAGLSLGLCGFSFWSHDIGGFVKQTPEKLYRRWLAFGMLTSHSRCHGAPPKEPWAYGEDFMNYFRKVVELKYKLMPYIYAQAKNCSEKGHPMLRTLFFEYPEDDTCWFIEDEYMFGEDILVAPFIEANKDERKVYLPEGFWIDYQTDKFYEGGKWYSIEAAEIPVIILIREGAVIPHAKVAQSTHGIDWNNIELKSYSRKVKKTRDNKPWFAWM